MKSKRKLSTFKIKNYIGQYSVNLLGGCRIVVPTEFREQLGSTFVISKGFEKNLIIIDIHRWEKLLEPLKNASFLDKDLRDTLRFLVGSAFVVQIDKQGRFVLPGQLREYMKLSCTSKTGLVFVGVYNWVELWIESQWRKREGFLDKNMGDIAQRLNNLQVG